MQREHSAVVQKFYQAADVAVAGALLVALLVVANLGNMPQGVGAFLFARITAQNLLVVVAFLVVWRSLFTLTGVYRDAPRRTFREEVTKVAVASSVASMFVGIFPATSESRAFTWDLVCWFWLSATVLTVGLRAARRGLGRRITGQPRQVLIVGSGPRALDLFRQIEETPDPKYHVLGFVDSPNGHLLPADIRHRMLGPLENLDQILMKSVVDQVMIALPVKSCYDNIQRALAVCEEAGVEAEYLPTVFQHSLARPKYDNRAAQPVVRLPVVRDDYRLAIKRAIDILGSVCGLVCLAPLMVTITVAIKSTSPGPVFFIQERYGLAKRLFRMYKFRSMVPDAESRQAALEEQNEAQGPVFKIRSDPRITPLGAFLRRKSLDELPQLLNVLRGDMSLVGPRPLPTRDVSRFETPHLMRRFSMKPGLTCLWQISGRSNTTFDHWIELDLRYIDNWSLRLDFYILLRTLPTVLRGSGAI